MKLSVLFHRLGPYHRARLEAAARVCELTAIELSADTAEYGWEKIHGAQGFERVTLFPRGDSREAAADEVRLRVRNALDKARPEAVAIPGWSDRAAFMALAWCVEHGVPAMLMSESTAHDEPRVWWKEFVKRRVVRLCSTALVGGRLHTAYLEQLGLHRDRIFTGYDVVDNEHFSKAETLKTEMLKGESGKPVGGSQGVGMSVVSVAVVVPATDTPASVAPPSPFFLASARFISKKNLPLLLRAYARYRETVGGGRLAVDGGQPAHRRTDAPTTGPWPLVLLGDGPLRSELCALISDLCLQDSVLLPGFIQYDELPAWYARAGAFVHASTTEQWGLVVNEAVAAGLPVIVSNRCGCVPELVREGVNGFTFDPNNVEELAALLLKISAFNFPLSTFGTASREISTHYEPARFGEGLRAAAELAVRLPRRVARPWDRALLNRLSKR